MRFGGAGGSAYLCTTAGSNSNIGTLPIEFTLRSPLEDDLEVAGKDMIQGGKGLWLQFQLSSVVPQNTITVTVLEENVTVATADIQIGPTTALRRWDVPFVTGSSHTFPAGGRISVRVSASAAVPSTMTFNTDQSYLLLSLTEPPIVPSVSTAYDRGKPTAEFHPNWPDDVRRMIVEGDVASVFGASDILRVNVTIRNPSGEVVSNGTAQLSGLRYSFNWSYPRNQIPGNYNVTVTVHDQQLHEFVASTVATMLRYAVYVTSPQADADGVIKGVASPPRGGSEAKDAAYTLDVVNTGYSATSVTVRVSSDPPPGWSAELSPRSLASIEPGASTSVNFTVSAGEEVDFGTRAVIYVEAIADADPKTPRASWTVQSVTNATMSRNFELSIAGPSENWVDVGQTATYQLLAQNKGVLDMNLTFSVSGTPVGWSHRLDAPVKVYLDTAGSSQKTINLEVTAPPEEVANISREAQITVTAQAMEEPELEKAVTTVTRLITILSLSVEPSTAVSDPTILGGRVDFRASISNLDPVNSHQVRVLATPPEDWLASTVKFEPRETVLNAGGSTTITISVTPPSGAVANEETGYQIGLKVEPADQPTRSNSTTLTVKIRQRFEISLEATTTSIDISPGQRKSLTLTVKNLGNGEDSVILYVAAGVPQDWEVHLNEVVSPPSSLTLQLSPSGHAGDVQTINVTIQPSGASKHSTRVNITIAAKSPKAAERTVSITAMVEVGLWDRFLSALNDTLFIIALGGLVCFSWEIMRRRSRRQCG
ncbi:MAG: COG1470 family protein [Thermoplasmatota archaeon]